MKRIFCLLILAGFLLSPFTLNLSGFQDRKARAVMEIDTKVIDVDTTWTRDFGPYVVMDNTTVASGTTLTIEAGTIVKFDGNGMRVEGKLLVNGLENEIVVFTSMHDDAHGGKSVDWSNGEPMVGDWGGIKAWKGGQIEMNYAALMYGGSEYVAPIGKNFFFKTNQAQAQFYSNIGVLSCYQGKIKAGNSLVEENKIGVVMSDGCDVAINNSFFVDNELYSAVNYSELEVMQAENNFWGHMSGPKHETLNPEGLGGEVQGMVDFDPWTGKIEEQKRNPVLIVPGIMGSYLFDKNGSEEVWPNILKMALPGDDSYLDELVLSASGYPNNPVDNNVIATDIFRQISDKNFFQGLIEELELKGYEENKDLFVFPYDWRLNIEWTAGEPPMAGVPNLKDKILEIKTGTGAEKIDLIVHSMGGLVAKDYMLRFGTSSVGKFIDIATPHLGAPKAFKVLNYGDDMGFKVSIFGLNQNRVKIISQNMPAVYALLPGQKYFSEYIKTGENPAFVADIYDYDSNQVEGNLDFDESQEFMKNSGRNEFMLDDSNDLHERIDGFTPENSTNIVVCGHATVGKIYVLSKEKTGEYEYAIKYIDGDGTVPLLSAKGLDTQAIYTNGAEHAFAPSVESVKKLVVSLLSGEAESFAYANFSDMSLSEEDVCGISGTAVSYHSPIDLHVYDEQGLHVGPNEDGGIDLEIPGAVYDTIDTNKFVFLPVGNFTVKGQAQEEGEFSVRISRIENNVYGQTELFKNLPLDSNNAQAQIDFMVGNENHTVMLDQQGDGIFESGFLPDKIFVGEEAFDADGQKSVAELIENLIEEVLDMHFQCKPNQKKNLVNDLREMKKRYIKYEEQIEKITEKFERNCKKTKVFEHLIKIYEKICHSFLNLKIENIKKNLNLLLKKGCVGQVDYDIIIYNLELIKEKL